MSDVLRKNIIQRRLTEVIRSVTSSRYGLTLLQEKHLSEEQKSEMYELFRQNMENLYVHFILRVLVPSSTS